MKVYKIVPDLNAYQSLLLQNERDASKVIDYFDGTPMTDKWTPPPVFSLHPKLKRGDFWSFATTIAATPDATEKVRSFFEMAGEILPLRHNDEEFGLLNISECINCLDADKCEWSVTNSGLRLRIVRFSFFPNRFTESSIFKIPESKSGNFTYEQSGDSEEEFKAYVEEQGMTGLLFEEVWRSE